MDDILNKSQQNRVLRASIVCRSQRGEGIHFRIWRNCNDPKEIRAQWDGRYGGGWESSTSVDDVLDKVLSPYEGETARKFFTDFERFHPLLCRVRDRMLSMGLKDLDLTHFYLYRYIDMRYTLPSGTTFRVLVSEKVDKNGTVTLEMRAYTSSCKLDHESPEYFRDMAAMSAVFDRIQELKATT